MFQFKIITITIMIHDYKSLYSLLCYHLSNNPQNRIDKYNNIYLSVLLSVDVR